MRQLTVGCDHPFPINLEFLPDGRGLVGVLGMSLLLWDLTTGSDRPAWIDESGGVLFRFATSPCGQYAAGAEDRCLVVWDLTTRKPSKWLMAGNYEHIADVAFTPDGREVFTVLLEGGGVVRRRVGTWRKKPRFGASPGRLGGRPAFFTGNLAISPDGGTLVTNHYQKGDGGLSGIKLWDLQSRTHIRTAVCGPGSIDRLGFSPDGRVLAALHDYRKVCLYDADTLALVAVYAPPLADAASDPVVRFAFHPGGRLLAVSGDTSVTLLDVDGLRPVQAFDWGIGRTFGVAFSPDGMLAAVSGEKGRVMVWDMAD